MRGRPEPFGSLWPSRGHCSASKENGVRQVWEIHGDTSPSSPAVDLFSQIRPWEVASPPSSHPALSMGVGGRRAGESRKEWHPPLQDLDPSHPQVCGQLRRLGDGGKVHPSGGRRGGEGHTVSGEEAALPPPADPSHPNSSPRGKHFSFLPGR